MKLNGKTKDGIYKRFCFSVVPFSTLQLKKNENRYNGSYFYFPFLFVNNEKGKGNIITFFLFSIMESEN